MSRSIFTISLILLLFGGVTAGTIKVPTDYATIQAGINAAFPGDTVLVADGTYYENIDFKGKAITVASYYLFDGDTTHVDSTIINGSQPVDPNQGSVVTFQSGEDTTSVLYGFTITGGSGTFNDSPTGRAGGGILCLTSGAKIIANKVKNNTITAPLAWGGGLAALPYNNTSYLILQGNQFKNNTVTANSSTAYGGGMFILSNAILKTNSISDNACTGLENSIQTAGGGIYCIAAQGLSPREIIMENNTITYNSVHSYCNAPGALIPHSAGISIGFCNGKMSHNEVSYNEIWDYTNLGAGGIGVGVGESPESFIIDSNIIRENSFKQSTGNSFGGGMQVFGGTGFISIMNNIIEENNATYGGGMAIYNTNTAQIVNNTIINNRATYGGGISVHDAIGYVMNCIVWGNQATTDAGIHVEFGSIQVAYCDVQGDSSGTGNINADPLFADALFHLSNHSPCLGKGTASFDFGGGMICYCPATDIADSSRPNPPESNPDMGAYESPLPTEVMNLPVTEIPQSYFLAQNYPNPFNPTTTIEFALLKSAFVTLKVYNLLGEEVATLVAEQRTAGINKLNWDASGLASGVYLYRLEVGKFVQTNKLILLR
jgi:hypothetical protein